MYTVIMSATNAFSKWLKLELPRIPSPDGKRIGTQPLLTNKLQVSWQCHVIQNFYKHGEYTVIAIEANSRYCILMPFVTAPTLEEFERVFFASWHGHFVNYYTQQCNLNQHNIDSLIHSIMNLNPTIDWVRNTDMSINGHASDTEQWVKQMLADYDLQYLNEEDATGLAHHINSLQKRAKKGQSSSKKFIPIDRFIDDGMSRFIETKNKSKTQPSVQNNNVVSLEEFRNRLSKI